MLVADRSTVQFPTLKGVNLVVESVSGSRGILDGDFITAVIDGAVSRKGR